MAEFSVFYSWQSDGPRRVTRDVIHKAAAEAVARIGRDSSVDDSPRIDHDTLGVSGAPEIAGTIFRKIDQASVFLADLTFIAATAGAPDKPPKQVPNPNVLLELGYATCRLGWDRVVLVMNSHYGKPDDLIFDLKHRRHPITFKLGPDATTRVDRVTQKLSDDLEVAFRSAMQAEHSKVLDVVSRLDIHSVTWMKSFGKADSFAPPSRETMGSILAGQREDDALVRLLDLDVIRCEFSRQPAERAYSWTYLGKLVLRHLGFRKPR